MPSVSLRGYARHRRCTLSQVQKSIANGRLEQSVRRDARGRVSLDVAEADREWSANHDPMKVRDHVSPTTAPPLPRSLLTALDELRALLADGIHPHLFRLTGAKADVAAIVAGWRKLPDVLTRLEDGLHAAGVPLRERDMPRRSR